MQESSLLLSLFNRIALQNKAKQNPGKQISLQNKQTTSDLKVWLCCVMYTAENKLYAHGHTGREARLSAARAEVHPAQTWLTLVNNR